MLETTLAIAAGIMIASGMAGISESESWSAGWIVPGLAFGSGAAFSLVRRHMPITPWLLGLVSVLLLVLVMLEAGTARGFLPALVWSAMYLAVMFGIFVLRRKEPGSDGIHQSNLTSTQPLE